MQLNQASVNESEASSKNVDAAPHVVDRTPLRDKEPQAVPFGKRIAVLDGIRGVAILMVLAFHTTSFGGLETTFGRTLHMLTGVLWCGVDLFFVLSGFLITGILLDSKSAPHYFRNFYARRTLRIFPLYYAVLLGVVVTVPIAWKLTGIHSDTTDDYIGRILGNQGFLWTYTQNFLQATGKHTLPGFGHFWSLAIEEQFYLVWPLVIFVIARRHLAKLCIAIVFSVLALRIVLYSSGVDGWALRQWTFTRFDSLVVGALAAYIFRTPTIRDIIKPHLFKASVLLSVCFLVIVLMGNIKPEDSWMCTIGYSILAVLFGAILLEVTTSAADFRILDSSFLRTFGKYSYAIYVFHWPITHAVRASYAYLIPNSVVFGNPTLDAICRSSILLIVVTLISFLLAIASWNCWEKHWLRLKHLFEYQRKDRREICLRSTKPHTQL